MPANTGFGSLNIGKDVVVDVTNVAGQIVPINITTSFSKKQNTKELSSKGLDGINRYASVPDGWSGEFMADRADSTLDDFFAALEANYYATGQLNSVRITETITEANGTFSQYRYLGVTLSMPDGGTAQGEAYIKQKIAWHASKRVKVQ